MSLYFYFHSAPWNIFCTWLSGHSNHLASSHILSTLFQVFFLHLPILLRLVYPGHIALNPTYDAGGPPCFMCSQNFLECQPYISNYFLTFLLTSSRYFKFHISKTEFLIIPPKPTPSTVLSNLNYGNSISGVHVETLRSFDYSISYLIFNLLIQSIYYQLASKDFQIQYFFPVTMLPPWSKTMGSSISLQ